MDHATSANPAVQRQLDRLWALSPGADILGLDRITTLARRASATRTNDLPPVFHVAGTNGKGSTCAFLRAAIEAAGYTAHVYTSPHLVRFNERIRIAGTLIDDGHARGDLLDEVLNVADGIGASFFEVTTAVAFLAFSSQSGGCLHHRGRARRPAGCHQRHRRAPPSPASRSSASIIKAFSATRCCRSRARKAGIAKPGCSARHDGLSRSRSCANMIAAHRRRGRRPGLVARGTGVARAKPPAARCATPIPGFTLVTHRPRLVGTHQSRNLALAIAMLRHQHALDIPEAALQAAADWAHWPARMQRLGAGPLTSRLPARQRNLARRGAQPRRRETAGEGAAPDRTRTTGDIDHRHARQQGCIRACCANCRRNSRTSSPFRCRATHTMPPRRSPMSRKTGSVSTATTAPFVRRRDRSARRYAPRLVLIAGTLYLAGEVLTANDEQPDLDLVIAIDLQ